MNTLISAGEMMRKKQHRFIAISPDAMAYDGLELMSERNVGALLVMEDGKLVGMFSERDYARKVILKGRSSRNTTIRELMSTPAITIAPACSLREAMIMMTEKHIRHLPVVDEGRVLGVMTIGDVVRALVSAQDSTIEELEEYIAGTGYRA
ncbi:MAG TPA: CBS domain-containing protein [Nitrospirota bacterium]|nr:CBS domain-containing protein [Nitrospirota bacterium]